LLLMGAPLRRVGAQALQDEEEEEEEEERG
jgi:hypothetical protein